MATHLEHVQKWFPGVLAEKMLDLGSGKGAVLIDAARKGGDMVGLEPSEDYLQITQEAAALAGVSVHASKGVGENIPCPDETFGYVNMTEVIEHVDDPARVLAEVHRVLKSRGQCYMSVPNRFGMRDPHFHLYFVNWLPRSFAHAFISIFGAHKDYADTSAGLQRLDEMHYYRYGQIRALCEQAGFDIADIREGTIDRMNLSYPLRLVVLAVYRLARFCYFDSFHLQLTKRST